MHVVHTLAPDESWNVPAGHAPHSVWPDTGACFPAAQLEQAEAPAALYVPRPHASEHATMRRLAVENLPASQSAQLGAAPRE